VGFFVAFTPKKGKLRLSFFANQPGTRPQAAGQPKAGFAQQNAAKPHKK
jgi:hypothetical protein